MATRLSHDEDNEPRIREFFPFWLCVVAWIIALVAGAILFHWLFPKN